MALERAREYDDFTAHVGIRAELEIAEHGDDVAVDSAIDIGIAEYARDRSAHGARDARVAEDGDDVFPRFSFADRRPEDCDDRVGGFVGGQMRVRADAHDFRVANSVRS